MTDAHPPNSYDLVPYTSLSHRDTHPDAMATAAMLFGMRPAPVERCRMLELGCASGGNLIPMAYGLPESEFLGIDYSVRQIEQGREMVAALGMDNVTLQWADIRDIGPDLGQFDYIIAHGVYSWVPAHVREHLLRICKQNLTPNGVAYVSYNVYPGWAMMTAVREMMIYHTQGITEPQERAVQARNLVKFLAESVPEANKVFSAFIDIYNNFLNEQRETSKGADNSLLLHDELAEVNDPCYFYQFMERATAHGLQYLGAAQYWRTQPNDFKPDVKKSLQQLARDRIDFEQYLDFLRNETFRRTLLCHQDISLDYKLDVGLFSKLHVASRAQPVSDEPDVRSAAVEKFRTAGGITISTDHPVSKAVMLELQRVCPQSVHFDTLLTEARAELGLDADPDSLEADRQGLAVNVLTAHGYSNNLIELHVHAPSFTLEIDERPVAWPVARLQAQDRATVTNVRHERVRLDEFSRYLIAHLDGEHDRQTIVDRFMSGPVAEGTLKFEREEEQITDRERLKAVLSEELDVHLRWMAQSALLMVSDGADRMDGDRKWKRVAR